MAYRIHTCFINNEFADGIAFLFLLRAIFIIFIFLRIIFIFIIFYITSSSYLIVIITQTVFISVTFRHVLVTVDVITFTTLFNNKHKLQYVNPTAYKTCMLSNIHLTYTVSQKNVPLGILSISLQNISWFSKLFHWHTHWTNCDKANCEYTTESRGTLHGRWPATAGAGKTKQTDPNIEHITPHFAQHTSLPCLALAACGRMRMIRTSIGNGIGYWYQQDPITLGIGWLSWYRSNPITVC